MTPEEIQDILQMMDEMDALSPQQLKGMMYEYADKLARICVEEGISTEQMMRDFQRALRDVRYIEAEFRIKP